MTVREPSQCGALLCNVSRIIFNYLAARLIYVEVQKHVKYQRFRDPQFLETILMFLKESKHNFSYA